HRDRGDRGHRDHLLARAARRGEGVRPGARRGGRRRAEPAGCALTPSQRQRPRDPEGRRDAIVWATVAVIAEHGLARTTHRRIADRADVALGSTTYYFESLDDLVATALHAVADAYVAEVDR